MNPSPEYPRGSSVPFPRRPYPQQVALMDTMLQAVKETSEKTKIIMLESPTGTGKSLSLACASLAWLEHVREHESNINNTAGSDTNVSPTSTTSTTGLSWIDAWKPSNDDSPDVLFQRQEAERLEKLEETLHSIRSSYDQSNRLHRVKQEITKAKVQSRKRQRIKRRKQQPLEFEEEDDDANVPQGEGSRRPQHTKGSVPWMLQAPSNRRSDGPISPSLIKPKIIYAARTHSQLSQFVSEVRKTKWGKTTKVISLASRSQGLCGYLSGNDKNESNLTEACMELRQSKKRTPGSVSGCACPFYHRDSIEALALHALAEPTDVEDWKSLGEATQTCSYYASRQALPHADMIVLPYSLLVCKETRESIGLSLENSLVLVDEAHNLPQAISNLQSCILSLNIVEGAFHQVQNYTAAYLDRLSSRHLHLLGQLKTILKAFQKSLSKTDSNELKQLHSPTAFLCLFKLDRINLFPLLRYMADSKLSQKLLGFVKKDQDNNKKKTFLSPMAVVETFLSKLNYANSDGKMVVTPGESLQFVVLNPAVASEDDLYHKPRSLCLVGGTLQPMDIMIQELVPELAAEAIKAQQAVSNGGSYQSPGLVAFSCNHVVPKSNVLLQALTHVNGTSLDIRHKTRSLPQVMTAIGKALTQLAKQVPCGMVVFFGSYKYEQALVSHWKSSSTWNQLQAAKPVFREPKDSRQTDSVLNEYGELASSSDKGALLLSVMGGKLSEGINFSNDLCRCVVVIGLPYPDPNDPLLQEKLKLLPTNNSYLRSLCLRSVNQSVGRAIRHANDFASIILMDHRYPQQDPIAKGLPKWLTDSTPDWRIQPSTLLGVERRVGEFFDFHSRGSGNN